MYWCESCGGVNFKNEDRMRKHLDKNHGIVTKKYNDDLGLETLYDLSSAALAIDSVVFICNVCRKVWKMKDKDSLRTFAIKHKKTHGRFSCDEKSFRAIISLLHYIDKTYDVHICSVKGIARKRVFLDGIAKEAHAKKKD